MPIKLKSLNKLSVLFKYFAFLEFLILLRAFVKLLKTEYKKKIFNILLTLFKDYKAL